MQPHKQNSYWLGSRRAGSGLHVDSPWISLREHVDKLMDNSLTGKPVASYPQFDHTNPPPAHTAPDKQRSNRRLPAARQQQIL